MSQPCSAPQLVIFDVALFSDPAAREGALEVLALAEAVDLPRGALGNDTDVAAALAAHGVDRRVDFWLAGDAGAWPFERALRLTGLEAARALFVSRCVDARRVAERHGLTSMPPDVATLERQLL